MRRHEHGWTARRNLRAAKLMIAGDANAEALFHCQQAVEKALKAFLTFTNGPFAKRTISVT
jgi:HEPN domain-containing protein